VFASAKGRFVDRYSLLLGTDNIVVVLLQSSGLQADATLAAYTNLGTLLASNTEATFTNYSRPVLSSGSITITVTTGVTVAIPSQVWTSAGGALNNTLGALLTCYRPTSGTGNSGILPLTKHDFSTTTTGGNLTATITTVATVT
jgi:hypothetical protein